jgi:hypothetical protein
MSMVWHEVDGNGWQSRLIPESAPLAGADFGVPGVRLVRFGRGTDRGVALLSRPGLRVLVNGQPVVGAFRILEHRDEVLVGRARFYFSAEAAPVVTVFHPEPGAKACTCPVCRGVIRDGDEAVQCPGCARWSHQIEPAAGKAARRCWTFAQTCRVCSHPTALSGEPVWRPEKEEAHV